MKFNPEKPVQTRDGRKARIICTDKEGAYSVVSLIRASAGEEFTHVHKGDGTSCTACDENDLINIPEKRWAVLHYDIETDGADVKTFRGEAKAQTFAKSLGTNAIALLPYAQGDGL